MRTIPVYHQAGPPERRSRAGMTPDNYRNKKNKYPHMKNINFYFASLLVLLSVACNPELESVNYDEINPEIFPASEADVEALVVAAYYPLRGSWWDGIHTTSENGIMFINDAST